MCHLIAQEREERRVTRPVMDAGVRALATKVSHRQQATTSHSTHHRFTLESCSDPGSEGGLGVGGRSRSDWSDPGMAVGHR